MKRYSSVIVRESTIVRDRGGIGQMGVMCKVDIIDYLMSC
jgi:hypothetical protein